MDQNLVAGYLQACATGKLALSDCTPILEVGITAVLVIAAVVLLFVARAEFGADEQAGSDPAS